MPEPDGRRRAVHASYGWANRPVYPDTLTADLLRGFRDRAAPWPSEVSFAQPLKHDVEHRDEEDADGAGHEHAGKHRYPHVAPADLRRPMREHQREQPED